ncbi:hypothetical protein [Pedobacter sp. SYSU D00535]|nr:hypothetical protein [Pedobacter sp. SYSU D00535]
MKKTLFALALVVVGFSSCKKEEEVKPAESQPESTVMTGGIGDKTYGWD